MSIPAWLFALLPLLTSVLVIRGGIFYAQRPGSARHISPSYFAAVALLFALFASLIFGEVWNRVTHINALMLKQASTLRGILRISEQLSGASLPYHEAVNQYIANVTVREFQDDEVTGQEDARVQRAALSNKTVQRLYQLAADTLLFKRHPVLQQQILTNTEELKDAWFERRELLKQRILPEKLLILFLMGFFTQVAVAFSHLGNDRALRDTVWLFSLVFFAAMAILVCIDDTALSRHFISVAVLKDVY